jgi:prepilin-type processing-associated H-X9-DG protein
MTLTSAPTAISIGSDLGALDLVTAQGRAVSIGAERLRLACKCAHCLRARFDGRFPEALPGIAITGISMMGGYAVNVSFSDGHARGIYPWEYLLSLEETAAS